MEMQLHQALFYYTLVPVSVHSHQNIPIMPLSIWLNGNKNNCFPFPVLFSAAVTVTTFHPQPDPSPHLLHFGCNHVDMQMLCTERFMLPSPGHHFQLLEPSS